MTQREARESLAAAIVLAVLLVLVLLIFVPSRFGITDAEPPAIWGGLMTACEFHPTKNCREPRKCQTIGCREEPIALHQGKLRTKDPTAAAPAGEQTEGTGT